MSLLSYLFLANNSLSGFLPSHISLKNLEELYLYGNQLHGNIPSSISNASKLNYLDLSHNKFNGVIPNALVNLRNLRWLDFIADACSINGKIPLEIGNLSHLFALSLFNNDLSGSIPKTVDGLQSLQYLNLGNNQLQVSKTFWRLLVMEFMPKGSLERWLYSHNYYLDFLKRLNIMIDVASALDYMHHDSSPVVVHCDVKPSNVLLDENMVAHLSDFGIAKLLNDEQSKEYTKTMATLGYIAPEYGSKGTISTKGDVYSFGIMLMETFTRKKPTDELFVDGLNMKGWISESLPHAITQIVDSNLLQDEDLPEERMNMTNVVASLNQNKVMYLSEN
ncbi:Serine/threonine-protein kinase, active site [Sesbania bispinosa]|nr:Serine/threonine-protein kinase, active site [Sesbania bispinosa]